MTNNILDVLTFMFDILFESAEQDSAQEVDDDLLKSYLSDAGFDADRIRKGIALAGKYCRTSGRKDCRLRYHA